MDDIVRVWARDCSLTLATCHLMLLFGLCFSVAAQDLEQQQQSSSEEPAKTVGKAENRSSEGETVNDLTEQQERALEVLDQLLENSKDWKDEDFKIQVQAQIADLLWKYDEERARRHFEEAFHAIDSITLPKAEDKTASESRMQAQRLRSQVLSQIAKHDPDAAEKLIETVAKDAVNAGALSKGEPGRKEQAFLSQEMAMRLAHTHPQRAAELINRSLNSGITGGMTLALQAIQRKNPALADEIFSNALSVAQQDTARLDRNLPLLAAYVFPDRGPGEGIAWAAVSNGDEIGYSIPFGPGPSRASPAVTEQFLSFAYHTLMQTPVPAGPVSPEDERASAEASKTYMNLRTLLPLFEQHMPDKGATLLSRLNEIRKLFPEEEVQSLDNFMDLFNPSQSAQDLLKKAQTEENSSLRDMLYEEAAQVALRKGETDQVASILDKISDERIKSMIRSSSVYQAVSNALTKNDLDTAYRYLKDLSNPLEQVGFLVQMVTKLLDQKDDARAIQWLIEAEQLVAKAEKANDKIYTMLSVAEVATRLDPIRGLNLMTSIVKDINQRIASSRETGRMKTEQEGTSKNTSDDLVSPNLLLHSGVFSVLAGADFEAALSLAQSIVGNENSTAAQLAVCRGVLTKPREPQPQAQDKTEDQVKKEIVPKN